MRLYTLCRVFFKLLSPSVCKISTRSIKCFLNFCILLCAISNHSFFKKWFRKKNSFVTFSDYLFATVTKTIKKPWQFFTLMLLYIFFLYFAQLKQTIAISVKLVKIFLRVWWHKTRILKNCQNVVHTWLLS